MKKQKKIRSLQHQLTFTFIGLVLFSIVTIFVINGVFLEKYYVSKKTETLLQAKEVLESIDVDAMTEDEGDVGVAVYQLNGIFHIPVGKQMQKYRLGMTVNTLPNGTQRLIRHVHLPGTLEGAVGFNLEPHERGLLIEPLQFLGCSGAFGKVHQGNSP